MTPTQILAHPTPNHPDGEIRIGWASWDHGAYKARSIKWAYTDKSGKISRGSPEIPFDILLDMLKFAAEQGELDVHLELAKSVYAELGIRLKRMGYIPE